MRGWKRIVTGRPWLIMIKVIVTGICGRMGRRIAALLGDGTELIGATEREGHPAIGKDAGEVLGLSRKGIIIEERLEKIIARSDVIIDFTIPQATLAHLRLAAEKKKGIVIGTTGFNNKELSEIERLAGNTACLLSPNMSVGVNLLLAMLGEIVRTLGDKYDIEIVESHHRHKKDAPSGTAKKIAEVLSEARGVELEKDRIHSLRAGDIIGEHKIIFAGEDERIELLHRAETRDTFARGAIRAAKFIARASPGLYTMKDL
jgi:4-hydroxy-tetrahydrodipicolinate reductase